jgi:hypothetical protein
MIMIMHGNLTENWKALLICKLTSFGLTISHPRAPGICKLFLYSAMESNTYACHFY